MVRAVLSRLHAKVMVGSSGYHVCFTCRRSQFNPWQWDVFFFLSLNNVLFIEHSTYVKQLAICVTDAHPTYSSVVVHTLYSLDMEGTTRLSNGNSLCNERLPHSLSSSPSVISTISPLLSLTTLLSLFLTFLVLPLPLPVSSPSLPTPIA